ncbi:MAG: DUF2243 domain-containing protein [Chthoniobacterales bacterium]
MQQQANHAPLITAGTFVGIGMGGFVDGILFHQILQLHNMLSAKVPKTTIPNFEINMFWDGMFHALTWVMSALGIALLWKAARRVEVPWLGKVFGGALFLGWGLFNLIEGIIDHHILNLHHVYEVRGQSIFDWVFLLSGVLFIIGGLIVIRSQRNVVAGSIN